MRALRPLGSLGRPVGPAAVVCLCETDVPRSAEVTAIPLSYL